MLLGGLNLGLFGAPSPSSPSTSPFGQDRDAILYGLARGLAQGFQNPYGNPVLSALDGGLAARIQAHEQRQRDAKNRRRSMGQNLELLLQKEKLDAFKLDRESASATSETQRELMQVEIQRQKLMVERLEGPLRDEAMLRVGTQGFWSWLDDRREADAKANAEANQPERPILDSRTSQMYFPSTGEFVQFPGADRREESQEPALSPADRVRLFSNLEEKYFDRLTGGQDLQILEQMEPGAARRLQAQARQLAEQDLMRLADPAGRQQIQSQRDELVGLASQLPPEKQQAVLGRVGALTPSELPGAIQELQTLLERSRQTPASDSAPATHELNASELEEFDMLASLLGPDGKAAAFRNLRERPANARRILEGLREAMSRRRGLRQRYEDRRGL